MNASECKAVKTKIKHRISELQELLQTHAAPAEQQVMKAGDAEQEKPTDIDRQIVDKVQLELARLQSNLKWIESDEGGICEQCDSDIPVARLRAVPVTRLCINCAQNFSGTHDKRIWS